MKIVLVGAGSAQFGYGTLGDIFSGKATVGCEISLLDIKEKSLDTVYQYSKKFIKDNNLDFKITATTNRKEAFKNADYIIISIEVGNRFELWDEDWKIPQQYGFHQVYGENGGPGGVIHALRITPVILEIVKDAMHICPEAYIFNYSNPMTAICTTVKRAYPKAKFIGLCHEIGWLSQWLPKILGIKENDISIKAGGLNHFSCLLEIIHKKTKKDLYPSLLKKAEAFFIKEPGYSDILDSVRGNGKIVSTETFDHNYKKNKKSNYEWADRRLLKFMLENYKLLPITVDSHFGEYIAWAFDVADHRGIMDFYDLYKNALSHIKPDIKLKIQERVVPIIEGIVSDKGFEESAVNILNDGIIEELPSWVVVEAPAIIDGKGITGIPLKNIPKGYAALLRNYTGVYDLTAEAILQKKKDYVIQAMLANPIVNKAMPVKDMVERFISCQNKWLGYLK